ncbi:hypothetical protein K438DRAFT_1777295 [Mycena galopus ATCC 62051]|nr:hypothetical protein K438DRAFT_1777295 [Mycena galopus ATCC 62051]
MSNTEESGHHTRAATRAGLFEAPPPVFGPAEAPSDSTSGSQHGSHSNSSPRATLYSTVVTGEPVPLEHVSLLLFEEMQTLGLRVQRSNEAMGLDPHFSQDCAVAPCAICIRWK